MADLAVQYGQCLRTGSFVYGTGEILCPECDKDLRQDVACDIEEISKAVGKLVETATKQIKK